MKVFWSWQSDTPRGTGRHFVENVLKDVIAEIAVEYEEAGRPESRPELDKDTQGEAGLVAIVDTIFAKIRNASVFVADVTPVAMVESRKRADGSATKVKPVPNPNVMIELGYALSALGHSRIVCVANDAHLPSVEDLPFDLRHRRGPITFALEPNASSVQKEKAGSALRRALKGAITDCLAEANNAAAEAAPVTSRSHREGDRSVWFPVGEPARMVDGLNGRSVEYQREEGSRFYLRVIPSGWRHAPPKLSAIAKRPERATVWAPTTASGDYGSNADGYVSVAIDGQRRTYGEAQWFRDTGEYWLYASPAVIDHAGNRSLNAPRLFTEWAKGLRSTFAFYDRYDAFPTMQIVAGLTGLEGAGYLVAPAQRLPSAIPEVIFDRRITDRSRSTALSVFEDMVGEVFDAFAIEPCAQWVENWFDEAWAPPPPS